MAGAALWEHLPLGDVSATGFAVQLASPPPVEPPHPRPWRSPARSDAGILQAPALPPGLSPRSSPRPRPSSGAAAHHRRSGAASSSPLPRRAAAEREPWVSPKLSDGVIPEPPPLPSNVAQARPGVRQRGPPGCSASPSPRPATSTPRPRHGSEPRNHAQVTADPAADIVRGAAAGEREQELERGWRAPAKTDPGIPQGPPLPAAYTAAEAPTGTWRYRHKTALAPNGQYSGQFTISEKGGVLRWAERLPNGQRLRSELAAVPRRGGAEWVAKALPKGASLTLRMASRGALHVSFRPSSDAAAIAVVANPAV